MKTLKLAKTSVGTDEQPVTYRELIKAVVEARNEKGISFVQMAKRLRIIEALEKSNDELVLEDADFELLKELTNEMKWGVVHKDIVKFCEEVTNL